MNTFTKKLISLALSVLLLITSVTVVFAVDTNLTIGGNTQEHVVKEYLSAYANYQNLYLSGLAVPLDGSNGNPDMVIPGLNSADDMVPQGLAYYPEKNWALVSSYMGDNAEHTNTTSVIYALDFKTGEYAAKFNIYKANGSAFTGHVGGIAVSKNNLYICDTGSKISYIPLSAFENAQNGGQYDIKIAGTCSIGSANNNSSTSYLSLDDGILWMGNFYNPNNTSYDIPASGSYNSLVLGYDIGGCSSCEEEWNTLVSMSDSGTHTPSYVVACPNEIYLIQSVIVKKNTIYIAASWGRNRDSKLYIGYVNLKKKGTVKISLSNGDEVNAYAIESIKSHAHLPMTEGMFFYKDESGKEWLYNAFESAAYCYNGYDESSVCKLPTDVIWKIDAYGIYGKIIDECGCICHKAHDNFFYRIIYKIALFFWKLFETNEVCACGIRHY